MRLRSQGLSRAKIAKKLGITEHQVRKVIQAPDGVTYSRGIYTLSGDLKLTGDELLSPDEVLERINLDPLKFELINFSQSSYRDGSVKIQAKPRAQGMDWDKVLEKISRLEPQRIRPVTMPKTETMIELGLTDMHWGINTYEDYEDTLYEVLEAIRGHERIILITGSDGIHVNNFDNKTINDTQLEAVDLETAYEDAFRFYSQIIEAGLEQGSDVEVIYIPANHDRDISWAMAKTLERVYPDAIYNISLYPYKAIRWGSVALGWTHGDKGKPAEYDRLFLREFPSIFGDAEVIEIHSGHLHREGVTDTFGAILRCLPTGTKRNKWTAEMGLVSVPRFQVFTYDLEGLRRIEYI